MPNVNQTEQPKDDVSLQKHKELNILIRDQILRALGRPADLRKVQVRQLWDDHYRVNVLIGADAGSVHVANSYFVVTDSSGGLVAVTPKITRLY